MKLEDLIIQIKNKNSFLCVGLDTDIDKIPKFLLNEDLVLPIPKTSNLKNLKKMLKDLEKNLTNDCLERFSEIFPYPRKKSPLAII